MKDATSRAVLYARVSTDEQATSGYSLRQQMERLREWAEAEGYEVAEEVEDGGYSGAYLERPGLDRVRDLAEAGGVSVVVAQDADRVSRDPMHRAFLDEELERSGTRLLALDDWGDDSHEGELLRYLKGWVSKGERLKFAERVRRGLNQKVSEGRIVKGPRAPYGFRYDEDGEALVLHEPHMAVVRRIFRLVGSEGESLGGVVRRLTEEGVPSPTGGNWHKPTLRYMILNDLYRPHTAEEAAASGMLSQVAASALATAGDRPEASYGLWTWQKRRQQKRPDREDSSQNRYTTVARPREQWQAVAVDLHDAGLSRTLVDAARSRIADNTRRPASSAAQRYWQLSGGIARCAECGSVLSPRAHRRQSGDGHRFYYSCRQRYGNGSRTCPSTRNNPAQPLEEAVWAAVYGLISEPDRLAAQLREHIEAKKRQVRGDPDREERQAREKLDALEEERRGYLRQNARGILSDSDLDRMLAEVDAQRETTQKALTEAADRHRIIEDAERRYKLHLDVIEGANRLTLSFASAEDRRRLYQALELLAEVDTDGSVRISGVFSPEIYLLGVLRDGLDTAQPAVEEQTNADGYYPVVSSDSTRRCGG